MHVDLVVPVHNQAGELEQSIPGLLESLRAGFPYRWKLILVDHASTDGSFWAARKLQEKYPGVEALQVALPGRGRALKRGSQGLGDVFCYLDLHLAENLDDVVKLARAVAESGCDIAAGRRVSSEAGWEDRFVSGLYHLGLKLALNLPVADAQFPFKAVSRRVALDLVPQVRDEFWFFDTELLALAQARGWSIRELPVTWQPPQSGKPAWEEPLPDLMRRILELRRRLRAPGSPPNAPASEVFRPPPEAR